MTNNPPLAEIQSYAVGAANANGVDPSLFLGLIKTESGFAQFGSDGTPLTSSAGAVGLTQLMPGTGAQYGATDPYNWQANLDAGAKYLSTLISQFGNVNSALEAYNIGPGNLAKGKYLQSGQTYANTVLANAANVGDVAGQTGTANNAQSSGFVIPTWLSPLGNSLTSGGTLQSTVTRFAIGILGLIVLAAAIFKLSGGNTQTLVRAGKTALVA